MNYKSIYTLLAASMLFFVLVSCENEDEDMVRTTITPVAYTTPVSDEVIELDPKSNAVVDFEWEPAKAANGTLIFYHLLIDEKDGDFSDPLFISLSENAGIESRLSLTHGELNRLLYDVGIQPLEVGTLLWKVIATNGVDTASISDFRKIEMLRPEGFAENPVNLYLYGSGTEAGDEIADGIQFKKISDGVFELYTSLTSGTFKAVDKTVGTPMTFYLDGSTIKEGDTGETPATNGEIYRIDMNFNSATANLTEIKSLGLWMAASNGVIETLDYQGNSTWKATDIPIVFADVSWGKDERYKFRITEVDQDGQEVNKFWGSSNKDNNKPTDSTPGSYYYLSNEGDDSQWDFTYKFAKEAPKNDVIVSFKVPEYKHQIIVKP